MLQSDVKENVGTLSATTYWTAILGIVAGAS
jgi:hypothetical protein